VQNASHTLTSGKNEVMRGLIDREAGPEFSLSANQRTCDGLLLAGGRISLFESTNNQEPDEVPELSARRRNSSCSGTGISMVVLTGMM